MSHAHQDFSSLDPEDELQPQAALANAVQASAAAVQTAPSVEMKAGAAARGISLGDQIWQLIASITQIQGAEIKNLNDHSSWAAIAESASARHAESMYQKAKRQFENVIQILKNMNNFLSILPPEQLIFLCAYKQLHPAFEQEIDDLLINLKSAQPNEYKRLCDSAFLANVDRLVKDLNYSYNVTAYAYAALQENIDNFQKRAVIEKNIRDEKARVAFMSIEKAQPRYAFFFDKPERDIFRKIFHAADIESPADKKRRDDAATAALTAAVTTAQSLKKM